MSRKHIEAERLDINQKPIEPQPAVRPAKVDQIGAPQNKQNQPDALKVRADMEYVLVDLPLQLGQHVLPGTMLAIALQLNHLIALLRNWRSPGRRLAMSRPASQRSSTHNGTVAGTVMRSDPAVRNETGTVDVKLTGELQKGCAAGSAC